MCVSVNKEPSSSSRGGQGVTPEMENQEVLIIPACCLNFTSSQFGLIVVPTDTDAYCSKVGTPPCGEHCIDKRLPHLLMSPRPCLHEHALFLCCSYTGNNYLEFLIRIAVILLFGFVAVAVGATPAGTEQQPEKRETQETQPLHHHPKVYSTSNCLNAP